MIDIYPFVKEPAKIEKIKSTKAYELRDKLNRGEKLSADEKMWITEEVRYSSFSKSGIARLGWIISFRDVLKRFLYRQYGTWTEAYAFNKTCLRKSTYGRIDEIVELA